MNDAERSFLEDARRGVLATADVAGRPAAVPICFALVDDETAGEPTVVTPVDEKPKDASPRDLRRVRDVAANPRVALVVDRYDEDWSALAWVQVRGTATLVEPGGSGHGDAVAVLRGKYEQYEDHALDQRPLLRVDPGHVVSWAASGGVDVVDEGAEGAEGGKGDVGAEGGKGGKGDEGNEGDVGGKGDEDDVDDVDDR